MNKPTPAPPPHVNTGAAFRAALVIGLTLLASCSGGGGSPSPAPASPPPAPAPPPPPTGSVRASPASTFAPGCNGAQAGTLYVNAEVEPSVAVNPLNPNNIVGSWQQDRWSNGGSQGIVVANSFDAGATWSTRALPFSRCAGGTAANGGDFDRASDPWTTYAIDGSAYQIALSFTGQTFAPTSESALLVARSSDGGATWGPTTTLIRDGAQFFNDKGSIAADPRDARFVYATWDRLVGSGGGPTLFTRSIDNGRTWSTPNIIYNPGLNAQTVGNVIVLLPDGTLVDLFTRIDFGLNATQTLTLNVIRSSDRGLTWSQPVKVADLLAVGTKDPQTGAVVRDASILGEIAADPAGNLMVVWQDARFSNGARDAVAFSRSTDGGLTWSTPRAINGAPNAAAFVPVVAARADGVIGVIYYDFRDDTADATTLLTDLWLARSADAGRTWSEVRIAGPFDLVFAPVTEGGFFLGDYQALSATASRFVALFAVANADVSNRTDIYSPAAGLLAREAQAQVLRDAAGIADASASPGLRKQASDASMKSMLARWPGWHRPQGKQR